MTNRCAQGVQVGGHTWLVQFSSTVNINERNRGGVYLRQCCLRRKLLYTFFGKGRPVNGIPVLCNLRSLCVFA